MRGYQSHNGPEAESSRRHGRYVYLGLLIAALPPALFCARDAMVCVQGNIWRALGDGLNIWTGAHLALTGQLATLFDPLAYGDWFHAHFGGDVHTWSYPPSYLLLILPFGMAPPAASVLGYDGVCLFILFAALRACGFGCRFALIILLCPASLASLSGHSNGALFAAFLVAGLLMAERRPYFAGILIGLLTMKPQLGLLVPVFWLARGNWRCIFAATLTAVSLIVGSIVAFGWNVWVMFTTQIMPFMNLVLVGLTAKTHGGPRAMIMSVFSLAQQLGLGRVSAEALQSIATMVAICFAAILGRTREIALPHLTVALLLLSTLATPYIWSYDMIPASLAVGLLTLEGLATDFFPGELTALFCLWLTPGIAYSLAALGLPSFAPVLVVTTLVYWWRRNTGWTANRLQRA